MSLRVLLPLLAALAVHALSRVRDESQTSLAAILQSSGGDSDAVGGDFDVLLTLLQRTDLLSTLEQDPPDGFTIFAPRDFIMREVAADIAAAAAVINYDGATVSLPSEDEAVTIIADFFASYDKRGSNVPWLNAFLLFHIVPAKYTFEQVMNTLTFSTLAGFNISREGTVLLSAAQLEPPASEFRNPEIIAFENKTIEAKNGILHELDYALFPPLPKRPSPVPNLSATPTPRPSQLPTPSIVATPSISATVSPISTATSPASPSPSASPRPTRSSFVVAPIPTVALTEPQSTDRASPPPQTAAAATISATPTPSSGSCFPATARVHTQDGARIAMVNLTAGALVAASETTHSRIYLFTHKTADGYRPFIRLTTRGGHAISLSEGHYIYVHDMLVEARQVSVGDVLRTLRGADVVVKVERTVEKGLYAPHTVHGDIVIDGIVASTYTSAVHPALAHAALWPLRMLVRFAGAVEPLGSLAYLGFPCAVGLFPGSPVVY